MAALLAAAAEPSPPIQLVTLKSEGVALIYGRDEAAIEAGGASPTGSTSPSSSTAPAT